jgi:hypothetical protein
MSAPITASLLREKLGFLSDTDFARSLLNGEVHVLWDLDKVTTIIIEEMSWLFQTFKGGYSEVTLGDDNFCFYWGRFKEKTLSSISGIHAGHYKTVVYSTVVTNFLSRKITHPIQTMKFVQRTARGDSTAFMGRRGCDNPLQGLRQGNSTAPACWLMLSSVLMHCYKRQGSSSRIISPISGAIIDFLREIYVDDTDLIITRPEMVTPSDTQVGLKDAAGTWASWLNASGGAINPKKS